MKSFKKYNTIKQNSTSLTQQRKTSKLSYGENKIAEFLKKECLMFYREFFMRGLYSRRGRFLYFDFFIPEYKLCIEFDGSQHYSKDKTESAKENDFRKNAYCLKNGLNLLRIKYDQVDDIEHLICKKVDDILSK